VDIDMKDLHSYQTIKQDLAWNPNIFDLVLKSLSFTI
jgi:hypothetical protein